ncbi:MAG TPA: DUF5318 family protein [Frankiaceae bacterium]|nr:DUF5318 family protein [Frankiaceae bacterium]
MQRRTVVDYALARRATLADLARGVVSRREVCDAHPDLLRAARHHGESIDKRCPICRSPQSLVHVTYVYGDELREASGRARARSELVALSLRHTDLRVYVVEVCRDCSWNHLSSSFRIGTKAPEPGHTDPPAVRRPARGRAVGPVRG